jgi:tetratricopeptide (TPR) repeat protein
VQPQLNGAGLRAANEGRLDDAERFFKIYLLENPESASVHSNLGNVHQQQGDAAQAVRDYDRATQLAPDAPVPYLNRAIAKETLGVQAAAGGDPTGALALWRSAAADCDRAIELDPAEFAAWFDRGNIHVRLGDYAAALTDFTTAADLAPGLAGGAAKSAAALLAPCVLEAAAQAAAGHHPPPPPHPRLQATGCARRP